MLSKNEIEQIASAVATKLQPSSSPSPLRVSVDEAAAMLGISPRLVWRRIDEGKIKTVREGRRVLIRVEDLRSYSLDAE